MASTRRALVGIAIASIMLSACGSSDKSSSAQDATVTTTAANDTTSTSAVSSTSTSTASKQLANGEFVGTFSNVETTLKLANFTVTCPKSAAGTYLVNLVQATFEVESNPTHPEAGSVNSKPFEEWAPMQADQEWVVRQLDAIVSVRSATIPSDHSLC